MSKSAAKIENKETLLYFFVFSFILGTLFPITFSIIYSIASEKKGSSKDLFIYTMLWGAGFSILFTPIMTLVSAYHSCPNCGLWAESSSSSSSVLRKEILEKNTKYEEVHRVDTVYHHSGNSSNLLSKSGEIHRTETRPYIETKVKYYYKCTNCGHEHTIDRIERE